MYFAIAPPLPAPRTQTRPAQMSVEITRMGDMSEGAREKEGLYASEPRR